MTFTLVINESRATTSLLILEGCQHGLRTLQATLVQSIFCNNFLRLSSKFITKMCGALLSKFKTSHNKIDSAMMIFVEPRRVASKMKLANQGVACFQDQEFWKDGDPHGVQSSAAFRSKNSLSDDSSSESDDSSQDEIEAAVRALAEERVRVPPRNYKRNDRVKPRLLALDRDQQLMDAAREILAFHAYGDSSSSNTVRAVQPLSSTDSTLPRKQVKTAVAFDIPVGDKTTVCPPARVPRRLRKEKVAPERTLEDMKEKIRAADERKLKELHCIQECARSRVGVSRPRPAETSAQATAAKQEAVESKWNEEMEKRKQLENRASKSRIAAAQAFAKTQVQSSIKRKVDETEKRKEKRQQKIDKQNKLRGNHAKNVKDKVSINCKLQRSIAA